MCAGGKECFTGEGKQVFLVTKIILLLANAMNKVKLKLHRAGFTLVLLTKEKLNVNA